MATVDTLNLEVKTNAEQAATGIRNLTKALNNMYRNLADDKKIGNLSRQFANLNSALNGISESSLSKVERLATALSTISKTNVALKTVSKSVADATKIPDVAEVTTGKVGGSGSTTKINPAKSGEETEKVAEKYKRLTKSLKNLGESYKKIISPVTKFIRALGRVAFYRAVRFALKSIVDGIKVGSQNLVQFSALMNGQDSSNANGVFSQYASEFLYFKNAIATAVIPVIAMFKDAISTAIERTIDFINVIAQVMAALNGQGTYTKAKFVWVDYANSIDDATGSVKNLNKQLAGFDELNNLTTSQSGGSGVKTPNFSEMFTDPVDIEKKWSDFASDLKYKFDDILNVALLIGEAILGWKVGSGIANFISSWLNLPLTKSLTLSLGLSLAFAGWGIEIGAIAKEILTGEWTIGTIVTKVVGFIAATLGGILVGITLLASSVGTVTAGVIGGAVFAFIGILIAQFGLLLDAMINGWNKTKIIAAAILTIISPVTAVIVALIGGIITLVKNLIKAFAGLNPKFNEFANKIGKAANEFANANPIVKPFIDLLTSLGTVVFNVSQNFVGFKNKISDAISELRNLININNSIANNKNSMLTTVISSVTSKIKGYASGGFPTGDLFMANENGAEMIGSIGGRTAVANNDEITEAIASATYKAMSQALRENGGSITIEGDPNGMFRVIQKQARTYTRSTGKSAF